MKNKIKLFFIALKEAYMKLTKDQREAKNVIELTKVKVDYYQNNYNCLDLIYNNLNIMYSQFPKSQRQLYIQRTLDLLKYGFYYKEFKNDNGETVIICTNGDNKYWRYSYLDTYKSFVSDLKRKYNYMKALYKEHRYFEVFEEQKEFYSIIDDFNKKYINDIEDPTSKAIVIP